MASISEGHCGGFATEEIVVLSRAGLPPLRMRARQACRHHMQSYLGTDIDITLWIRANGGAAVSFTRPVGARLVPDSAQADSVGALAEWMEQACARLQEKQELPGGRADLERLLALQGARALSREFMTLVGDALADWEAVVS